MDKQEGLQSFWESFGVDAYEESSVPEDASFPYITYEKMVGALDENMLASASIWTRSTSWSAADELLASVSGKLKSGALVDIEQGKIFIRRGVPFAQGMDDDADKMVKRYSLNIELEFFTAE